MVLDQNITTLLSTVIGGLLAITGGFLATSFSQRMAEKAEKRNLVREKLEEFYMLSNIIQEWVKVQVLRACEIEEITLHRKVPRWFFDAVQRAFPNSKTMLNTYKTCIKGTLWFLKRVIEEINLLDLHLFVLANTLFSELGNALAVHTEPDCPIERMEIIASLYLPSLRATFTCYRKSVLAVQQLETDMRNSMSEKTSLEAHCSTNILKDPDIQERIENGNNIVVEFVVQLPTNFEECQESLLAKLQHIAVES